MCQQCEASFTFRHPYKETKEDCPDCNTKTLVRQLTMPAVITYSGGNLPGKQSTKRRNKGEVVTEAIEETRAEIKKQKKALKDGKA